MEPWQMALLRSFGTAAAAGLSAGLGYYLIGLNTDVNQLLEGIQIDPMLNTKALVTGALALLAVVGGRGAVEGIYDQHRARDGQVSSADVSMASPKLTVIENKTGEPVAGQSHP